MKLESLASQPKLIKITLDDEDIVEAYGDTVEFWVWDRQPLEKFVQFAGKKFNAEDIPELEGFARNMVLNEEGNPVMTEGKLLPTTLMARCITKVMETLGK